MKFSIRHCILFGSCLSLLLSCLAFHAYISDAEDIESSDEIRYDYTEDINDEIEIMAKYDGSLLLEDWKEVSSDEKVAELEEAIESSEATTEDNSALIAEVDEALSNREKDLNTMTSSTYSTVSTTATTAVENSSNSNSSTTIGNTKKNVKSTKNSVTSIGKLKWGSDYDSTVTKDSLKNSDSSTATDNSGKSYKKGALIGDFVITGYCTGCNSPKGSRSTSSGRTATSGISVAVNSSQIKLGTKIIIGDHVYIADDRHGNNNYSHVVDVFLGDSSNHKSEPLLKNIPVYIAVEE